jgi:hypothetical protein
MNNRVDDWGKEPGQKCWSDLNAGERREYARNPLWKNRRVCRLSELELMRRVIGVIDKWNNRGRRDRPIQRLTRCLTEETALTDRHIIAASQASIPSASGARDAEKNGTSVTRSVLLTILLAAGCVAVAYSQATDATLHAQLKQLFPAASAFSPKGGDPPHPHIKAFSTDPRTGLQTLLGLAFWTTELAPLERGYDGPIKILVGMDLKGVLTGIVVSEHHEPYGSFSLDPPRFPAQFRGKDIRDAFKVGMDIDAVSRATISITSASRAIRYSSRQIARQLLAPPQAQK